MLNEQRQYQTTLPYDKTKSDLIFFDYIASSGIVAVFCGEHKIKSNVLSLLQRVHNRTKFENFKELKQKSSKFKIMHSINHRYNMNSFRM